MKSTVNPKLQSYLNKEYSNFTISLHSYNFLRIHQDSYTIGYLGENKESKNLEFIIPNADRFIKLDAYGILKEVLLSDIPFNRIYFNDRSLETIYCTRKELFIEHGIVQKFYFGEKLFLPIHFFREYGDDQFELFQ